MSGMTAAEFTESMTNDQLIQALGHGKNNIFVRELIKRYKNLTNTAPPQVLRRANPGLYVDRPEASWPQSRINHEHHFGRNEDHEFNLHLQRLDRTRILD